MAPPMTSLPRGEQYRPTPADDAPLCRCGAELHPAALAHACPACGLPCDAPTPRRLDAEPAAHRICLLSADLMRLCVAARAAGTRQWELEAAGASLVAALEAFRYAEARERNRPNANERLAPNRPTNQPSPPAPDRP